MENEYNYIPLAEPKPISEQVWTEGTIPLVSTVTLAYNHERYIKECLDGILMQKTTFPVQVLVHEDCSTDSTATIIKEYQEKYPKLIKVYYQPENVYSLKDPCEKIRRREVFNSWQLGRYIASCEGDDYWTDPLKLQKQVSFMESHPEYSACAHRYMTLDDGILKLRRFIPFKNRVTLEDLVVEIPFQTATVVYRKKAAEYPKEYLPYMRDTFHFMILAEHGDFYIMDDIMSVYRIHSGGVWSRLSRIDQLLSKEASQLKIMEYFSRRNQPIADALKFKLSQYCVRISLSCLFALDFKGCLFCLRHSFKYSNGQAQIKEYLRLIKKAVLYISKK